MLFQRMRHVSLLLSPTALAITCRVLRQRAIHIHSLFLFLRTNDHSLSNSIIVASGSSGSGAIIVSPKGGGALLFFYQTFTVFRDTPNVLVSPRKLLRS